MMEIMQRLKEETAQAHKDTEKHSKGSEIMSRQLSLEGYSEILMKNYQVHEHFETCLQKVQGLDELFGNELNERWRTDSLKADLQKLGADPIKFDGELPVPLTIAEALGCMYVLEGSTLGGAVIMRQLQHISDISEKDAFAFYGFYGKELGKKWQEFGLILTNFASKHKAEDEVAKFARTTFEAVEIVFRQTFERVES
jgi:heme oxygenase